MKTLYNRYNTTLTCLPCKANVSWPSTDPVLSLVDFKLDGDGINLRDRVHHLPAVASLLDDFLALPSDGPLLGQQLGNLSQTGIRLPGLLLLSLLLEPGKVTEFVKLDNNALWLSLSHLSQFLVFCRPRRLEEAGTIRKTVLSSRD